MLKMTKEPGVCRASAMGFQDPQADNLLNLRGQSIIGFRQDCLNLDILVTCQHCTEEVSPLHRCSEHTCQNTFSERIYD